MALIQAMQLHVEGRLAAVDLRVAAGELVGVIGPNGAGKSTLLAALAGLQRSQGQVCVGGQDLASLPLRQRARLLGYLPQAGHSAWALRVEEVVALGRLPWGDSDAGAIAAAMAATGADALAGRRIHALSGGEQARVWLARVLAGQPQVLLADEPVASLDLYYQRTVMQALRRFADSGRAGLVAIHDLGLAARHCDRLLLLDAGRVQADAAPGQVLDPALLERVYRLPVSVAQLGGITHVGYR